MRSIKPGLVLILLLLGAWPSEALCQFQALGAGNANAAGFSLSWPTHQANDIGLLVLETSNQAVTLGTNGSDWTEVTSSPQGTGASPGGTRLTVFWSRASSSAMGAVAINDSGDHQIGGIVTFRGCISSGTPYDVTNGDVDGTGSTTVTIPGATTTVANTLVVAIVCNGTDSVTTQTSGWTNSNLTSVTEQTDGNTTAGDGGGFGLATGDWASTGDYGATTATLAGSSIQGRISLALKQETGAATPKRLLLLGVGAAP